MGFANGLATGLASGLAIASFPPDPPFRASIWQPVARHGIEDARLENPTAIAKFSCHGGKTVSATFYSNSVELKLSDGRRLNMPQTLSGSGARYANSDETFVFWNKGDTAFITEGNGKETYLSLIHI